MNRLFKFSEKLYQTVKLHFIWLLFILRGFIILGIFPATAALYAFVKNPLKDQSPKELLHFIKNHYKKYFKVSNVFGWTFLFITFIILFNFIYISIYPEMIRLAMYTIILFISFLMLICWIYLFPVIVHYELSNSEYFVMIFRMGFSSLSSLIVQLLILGIYIFLIYLLPPLFLFIGIVPLAHFQLFVSSNILQLSKKI